MNIFDKAYVISLPNRRDRLDAFLRDCPSSIRAMDIEVWPGVTGVKPPEWATPSDGAWGAFLAHFQILAHAIRNKMNSLLILEDDACFLGGFNAKLETFAANLPDWQQVYLGGQLLHHIQFPPTKVNDHVYAPHNVNRAHAYAIHKSGYQAIYEHMLKPFGDVFDHQFGRLHETGTFKVLCPAQWLVGQREGKSDVAVNGQRSYDEYWLDPGAIWEADQMMKSYRQRQGSDDAAVLC